ncbi:hypothetical protein SH584_08655 [Sphingomonas sp. LY29]|uniref:hypothetical protein n=1 Tax=Sphingomonas sp. LY29 TaxID=3095341 RepID=UPI002D799CDF|nr:hypothetical protein [Sphingomonas sp. LY29]WRP25119.1 hypothetical protein SH584_08655 [Sphingomonas sp. LY29]
MKIDAENYEQMRASFARLVRDTVPVELLTAETDPVICLDQLAAQSPAKARQGLAMAIGDTIEATDGWPRDRVAAIDDELALKGLPSLSAMRFQFSKVVRRVAARGSIKNDVEYHAVRNTVEMSADGHASLCELLSAYEQRLAG